VKLVLAPTVDEG
jgi:hypothetical protein